MTSKIMDGKHAKQNVTSIRYGVATMIQFAQQKLQLTSSKIQKSDAIQKETVAKPYARLYVCN